MNNGGIGSASIVLVFAVLCLAIFSVISLVPAMTEQTLIDREARLVGAFYSADTLAEKILAEILEADEIPETIRGVDIIAYWDWDLLAERVYFATPVSDTRELYVSVLIGDGYYEILTWSMVDIGDWEADESLNVWQGFSF